MARGGKREGAGRPVGSLSKTTVAVKEAMEYVYSALQDDAATAAAHDGSPCLEHGHFFGWAKDNSTEFYKLYSKLIPHEVKADVTVSLEDLLERLGHESEDTGVSEK